MKKAAPIILIIVSLTTTGILAGPPGKGASKPFRTGVTVDLIDWIKGERPVPKTRVTQPVRHVYERAQYREYQREGNRFRLQGPKRRKLYFQKNKRR